MGGFAGVGLIFAEGGDGIRNGEGGESEEERLE